MHPPLGVDGQPVEGEYTWDVVAEDNGEDELLTIGNCVVWKRGGVFRKSFNLDIEKDSPILLALLTYFPATDADNSGAANNKSMDQSANNKGKSKKVKPTLAKALVVFLRTQAHIFFLSGTSHIVHMPFEVESACAAPVGVIIQRKPRVQNLAPIGLRFPRVPPNSFMSSQLSPAPHRQQSAPVSFSVEGLALPKTLPLRLATTMETLFDTPLETNDSHWPRLVCLTDPLLELGLVVNHASSSSKADCSRSAPNSPFLDMSEEILHVETVEDGLVLAVTANREANLYTVWQLTYVNNEDIFTKHQKKRRSITNRRRSSMQPMLNSAATTPVVPSFRESLGGGTLPGKKTRTSDKPERVKSDDIAVAFAAETEVEKAKRQSRRISSLLARADLSASHERATFAEQSITANHAENRRLTGAQRARQSGGPGNSQLGAAHSLSNLSNLREADDLLDELRAGGDFEGFNDMGLDDHSFDGLTREMLLTKIHSVSIDNTNVRYSLDTQPARAQYKVFIVNGPPFATDESGRRKILIGIQDPLDKRLQLLPLCIEKRKKSVSPGESEISPTLVSHKHKITPDVLRRAYNVVDSCKIFDGDQSMILILSENTEGQRELSIQAPWSAMTTLTLPMLYASNIGSLEYTGTHVNREVKGRRSIGSKLSATDISRMRHSRSSGVVDLEDRDGNIHRIQIQLQPSNPQVRKILQVCRSVLPTEASEKMLAGWWHIMNWVEEEKVDTADREWSSLVIEIFSLLLALVPKPSALEPLNPSRVLRHRRSLDPSAGTYQKMVSFTALNNSAESSWMQSHAWRWMIDEDTPGIPAHPPGTGQEDFLTAHVRLSRLYMESSRGQNALGPSSGHLPTALNRGPEDRTRAAWGVICALHLLVEEEKLDIMSSGYSSAGRADLKVLLCQIGRWLGWHEFVALHELGVLVDLDPRNDQGKSNTLLRSSSLTTNRLLSCQCAGPAAPHQCF